MPNRADDPHPLLLYLHSRRIWAAVALTVALCAAVLLIGAIEVSVPASGADSGFHPVPTWRILAAGVTFGPVLSCHSPFGELEAATHGWRNVQAAVLLVHLVLAAALFVATCLVAFGGTLALLTLRGIIGWTGVALIAGRIFGWRLAWVGPLTLLPVMLFWGLAEEPHYQWWEFTARQVDDPAAWMVAGVLLAAGIAAWGVGPWQRRRWATWWRGRRNPFRPGVDSRVGRSYRG